jgi:farnesyl-diphosphate farnesyltransferase
MEYAPSQMLTSLLRDVSRSFYLTLRVLPGAIRPQIGLAYLLARTSDTIADTQLVPLDQRLAALQALSDQILGRSSAPFGLADLARQQGSPAERALLEKCDTTLALLRDLSRPDRDLVVAVLQTIISGQELDLRRFAGASQNNVIALNSAEELDDYTYRVAGCVGEFWTRICHAHLFSNTNLDEGFLLANGIRFGKGLQLVNILRDLPIDLRQGRCYLPADRLKGSNLNPADLLQPSNEERVRPLYNELLNQAEGHLTAGWAYTNHLPWRSVRVRLACAWPLLIGQQTIELLRSGSVLKTEPRLKVSRRAVKEILWRSVLYYPLPSRWKGLFPTASAHH